MKATQKYLYAMLVAVFLLSSVQVQAGYQLEPGFGEAGIAVEDILNYDDQAYGMVVQADGKIVIAGVTDNSSDTDVAILRFNSDGSIDDTFGVEGKVTFGAGSADDGAYGVVIQEDGKIVVAGFSEDSSGQKNLMLLRLFDNGSEDFDFGVLGSGVAVLEIVDSNNQPLDAEAYGIVIDAQGRLVVAGTARSESDSWALAARFSGNGVLDPSFGQNGFRLVEDDAKTSSEALVLQSDGKIILAGTVEDETLKKAALFRLLETGAVDTDFNDQASLSLTGDSQFYAVTAFSDDSLVAVGYTVSGGYQSMAVAKFTAGGQLDSSFGSSGMAVNDLGDDSVAYSVAVNTDGTLLIGGEAENGSNWDITVFELSSSGSKLASTVLTAREESSVAISPLEVSEGIGLEQYELIAALEESSALRTDINGEDDHGRDLVIVEGGRVYVAGYTNTGNYDDMALLAFVSATDTGTNTGGTVSLEKTPYFIATLSVTNISRNGAMTGGVITRNEEYLRCSSSDSVDCWPSVTARGVVYAMAPYPSYRSTAGDGTTGDSGAENTTEGSSVFPDWVANTSYNYDAVRYGQTSDGTGYGIYGSDIREVTPDVVYYVRAYAVLSDDTVIYGNQLAFKTDDACFIATAAYGSMMEPHVAVLRVFRDKFLQTNTVGQQFVQLYYHFSPGLAEFIGKSPLLRLVTRIALMPFVGFGYFMVYLSWQMKILFMLFMGGAFFLTQGIFLRR